jgi:hypothetical protein
VVIWSLVVGGRLWLPRIGLPHIGVGAGLSGLALASAGGDGGRKPLEHDDLERWCGGWALPWHRPDLGCRWWSARLAATAAEDGLSFRRATCVGRPSDENGARDQGEVGFVFVMTLPGPSLGGRALDDPLRTKQKYPVLLEYAKASFERIKQRLRHL